MSAQVAQLDLLAPQPKPVRQADISYVRALPTFRRALRYQCSLADLESKQVYGPLDLDKAVWSKIDNGSMSFPADKLLPAIHITQNDAALLWLCHQAGYDIDRLPRLRDDRERRIQELEAENEKLRREADTIAKFVRVTLR